MRSGSPGTGTASGPPGGEGVGLGLGLGNAQGGTVQAQGDAVVLQAIEQGIDQGLVAEELIPLLEVEVLCTVRSYAEKTI